MSAALSSPLLPEPMVTDPPEEAPGGRPAELVVMNGLPSSGEEMEEDTVAVTTTANNVSGRTSASPGDDDNGDDSSSTATHESSPGTERNEQQEAFANKSENEGGDAGGEADGGDDKDDNMKVDEDEGDRTADGAEDANDSNNNNNNEEPSKPPSSSKAAKKPSILGRRPSSASPPKMRIKLSLRTLPTLANRKAIPKPKVAGSQALPEVNHRDDDDDDDNDDDDDSSSNGDGEGSVKAMVVDSDEGEEDDVVASVIVEEGATVQAGGEGVSGGANRATTGGASANGAASKSSNNNKSSPKQQSGQPPKRRSQPGTRPIRMPPIASPALLMPQPTTASTSSGGAAEKEAQLPALLTIPSIANSKKAGASEGKAYVTPASVFDHSMEAAGYTVESRTSRPHRGSSVKRQVGDMFDSNTALTLRFPSLIPTELMEKVIDGVHLPNLLIDSIQRKRRRRFADMVPRSLTINYPEEFVQKRIEYVRQVEAREAAIVLHQESQEDGDAEESAGVSVTAPANNGANEVARTNGNGKVEIPPIPEPPSPPTIKELVDFPAELYKDQHPLYPPRFDNFASHLDPQAFHITEGRYFGLTTNCIADPNFVGPNAPGLTSVSTGSGLATSSAGGGGISGAMALTLATTFNGVTAGAASALKSSAAPSTSNSISTLHQKIKNESDESTPAFVAGPKPTATSSDLKKIMDQDDDLSSRMKQCIIRAAVHASRSGRHLQAFVGPNREIYPDISKAFAAHAGIKPCQRCKSNKQGAYHCRLRRRHRQLDYDGGDSLAVIDPLFSAPMESLLERL